MSATTASLTDTQKEWIAKARREDRAGWIHVRIQGAPFERGFQHGYLLAAEYAEAIRAYRALTYLTMGMTLDFFFEQAVKLHRDKITPELLEEMQGIAAGFSAAGVPATLEDVIGWNAYEELTGYWWPTVAATYASGGGSATIKGKSHCSAFIATGSATSDGKIVIGHTTFTEFWNGQSLNVVFDITPESGARMVMQGCPGWVSSMTDFWVTGAGLVVAETTIVGYSGYDVKGVPEYVRSRQACQYGTDVDSWIGLMNAENNGGYANMWLVGDLNKNEIAKYEQGLKYQDLQRKSDGWYFGCNAPEDPRIRNLECADTGYDDVRQQTGARRVRWPQALAKQEGRIDAAAGQLLLADTYDVYLRRVEPSSRTICAHYDEDPQFYASDPNAVWNIPFFPGGSVDGKVATAELAKRMGFSARFGRADGDAFDAEAFLDLNPQYDDQRGYLKSRPTQPWVVFADEAS